MKKFILCADDYGQTRQVSQAILTLIEKGRVSATSCLTNTVSWAQDAGLLKPLCTAIDIGLHINFTEGVPLSAVFRACYGDTFKGLGSLLVRSQLRCLDSVAVRAEIDAQCEAFVTHLGQLPHFIDGHHHVHQLPIIREALIDVYCERFPNRTVYLRYAHPKIFSGIPGTFKRFMIRCLGAHVWKKLLMKYDIPHNELFSGSYAFGASADYGLFFKEFLKEVEAGGIIMCHPGDIKDEFNYFLNYPMFKNS